MAHPAPITTSKPNSEPSLERCGRSIIAGKPAPEPSADAGRLTLTFKALNPETLKELPAKFLSATPVEAEEACRRAWAAHHALVGRTSAQRAEMLERYADALMLIGDALAQVGSDESGFGPVRIIAERDMVVAGARMAARLLREGDCLEVTIETAEPNRRPMPRPDIRSMNRAIGPVALMGPATSPVLLGCGGLDTISALAAGCPVVYKAHHMHPATEELVGIALTRAIAASGLPTGMYSLLFAASSKQAELVASLVANPSIRGIGFQGGRENGLAILSLAQARPDSVEFFGVFGSVNPVVILPNALTAATARIASDIGQSIVLAGGMGCTRPGLIIVRKSAEVEHLCRGIAGVFDGCERASLRSLAMLAQYNKALDGLRSAPGVSTAAGTIGSPKGGSALRAEPVLLRAPAQLLIETGRLHSEIVGPAAVIVVCENDLEFIASVDRVQGALVGTLWASQGDAAMLARVEASLAHRVGRLVYNGSALGVQMGEASVYSGPWPSATSAASGIGVRAIKRWMRPFCVQNATDAVVPPELRIANPLAIRQRVCGEWRTGPVADEAA